MRPLIRPLLLAAILAGLPGCATIAMNAANRIDYQEPPWNGEVRVASVPEGAHCQVRHDDRVLALLEGRV